ncbi:MAG: phage tail tape measure protein, partial [Lachnospiraceae bacterium]|nr:phage tail tape measure protein [Lachnospiraceae bacterium]
VIATIFVAQFVGALHGILAALTPLTDALSSLVEFVTNVINAIVALFKGDFSGACDFLSAAVDNLKDFFIHGFDAILSYVGGFVDGFLNVVGGALSAVGIDADSAISGIKNTVSNGLEAVKGSFGNIMGAAADTAKEKLNNIKNAYEENGGGIKGVVAAAQEAVNGYFSAGLTFIDNLTGGKLTAIKDKFQSTLGEAANVVQDAIKKIKGFFNFSWKLPDIKLPHFGMDGEFSLSPPSVPTISVKWFAEGGVMTSPTIFGAAGGRLLGGGEAGAEAILPLSVLWEKLKIFIHDVMAKDDDRKQNSAGAVVSALTTKEIKTLENRETKVTERDIQESQHENKKGNTIIQKLEIKVDMDNLKDLPLLFRLIDELKDAHNSTDELETA